MDDHSTHAETHDGSEATHEAPAYTDHLDAAAFEALSPKARVYVERLAKEMYLLEHGWENREGSRFWEQEVEGYQGEESEHVVARYRARALHCLEALIEARPAAEAA